MSAPNSPGNDSGPAWFRQAIATAAENHVHEFEQVACAYRTWGSPSLPALLLVHGGCAHSHWWDFIAPHFLDSHFVVAVDLLGMGNSGHSAPYSAARFADQLQAACQHAGVEQAVLLGHSMGGRVGLHAASQFPHLFPQLIVADARVRPPQRLQTSGKRLPARPHKVYPSLPEALGRFRLLPDQPCDNPWIIEHIARHSLREVDGGWQWKFDRRIIEDDRGPEDMTDQLRAVAKRMSLIYGEHSVLFNAETLAYMREVTAGQAPFMQIEDAQHHLFLDRPLEFVDCVRSLLSASP